MPAARPGAGQKFAPCEDTVYSSRMMPNAPLVRCGGCGEPPEPGRALRRGRCDRCYDAWVRARPIGLGASCAGCEDRRRVHLRYYEIGLQTNVPGGRWVVLCHNCVAFAESIKPPARSIEGLKMRLYRDRRWGNRRSARPGARDGGLERRGGDRRKDPRAILDGNELIVEEPLPIEDEQIIELEADYELPEDLTEGILADLEEVTGIHFRVDLDSKESDAPAEQASLPETD